ncbi:hypothetical protein V866_008106 [Kwoniella sp. B9012]
MDLNDQQQPSQTLHDEWSELHPLPNLAEDHITFVNLREEQDLPGIWEELDDILTEHNNIYSYSTPQYVTNTTPIDLRSADAQIQKLTRVVEIQATIIAAMNQAMRQIQTSLKMYQGGNSNMQDRKRKRKKKEKEVVVVNENSHPPDTSYQHDDHLISNNKVVVERPKGSNTSLSTPHTVGASSGSPIKTAKKGDYAPLRAKKAGSRCPIELVHKFEEDQGLNH